MYITLDVDLEKFRYSLIGDGYLKEEAIAMSQDKLIEILEYKIGSKILSEYYEGKQMKLFD